MSAGVFTYWPNRITAVRFVGSLVLFVLLATSEGEAVVRASGRPARWMMLSFWLFLLVALTDYLDGWLARRGNVVTTFGRIADPFVDKVLVLGTMIFLAVMDWSRDWFPAWIVVVVLAREFLVTGIRGYVESEGREFPADWFGKVKMVIQCVAIGVAFGVYAFAWSDGLRDFWSLVCHLCVWGTLLSSVGSGLSYVVKARTALAG